MSMNHFRVGDCVLVINAACEPGLIGHVGTVARAAEPVSGIDRFGRVAAGIYVVVDLPEDVNRHRTTLWYLRPEYLIKLSPPDSSTTKEEWIPDNAGACPSKKVGSPGTATLHFRYGGLKPALH
jgi:hypothetical protein